MKDALIDVLGILALIAIGAFYMVAFWMWARRAVDKARNASGSKIAAVSILFDESGDFRAFDSATAFLRRNGFSFGSMQRDEPIGVMYGAFDISKWRNLSEKDRAVLHGQLTGDKRNGPVTLTVFDSAPHAAITALAEAMLP